MVDPLSKDKLKSVYNKVSSWYDWQHALFTLNSDQKGRRLLVSRTVRRGDEILDAGAGTGTTALMAAKKAGSEGQVVLYDLSDAMLERAKRKAKQQGVIDRLEYEQGDMTQLPYFDGRFDVVLSTYSLCPLYDPKAATEELYRVVRPGGKIGAAHSTEPSNTAVRELASIIEKIYWKIPELSLGCRPVEVVPALKKLGAKVVLKRKIGVPLWPFLVFIAEKPKK